MNASVKAASLFRQEWMAQYSWAGRQAVLQPDKQNEHKSQQQSLEVRIVFGEARNEIESRERRGKRQKKTWAEPNWTAEVTQQQQQQQQQLIQLFCFQVRWFFPFSMNANKTHIVAKSGGTKIQKGAILSAERLLDSAQWQYVCARTCACIYNQTQSFKIIPLKRFLATT